MQELLELWEWSLTNVTETEMKGRIIGVNFIMKKFDFYFGCCLGKNVLRQTDILSKSLQSSSLSAAEEQDLATIVIKKLKEDRKNKQFEMFWEDIMKKKEHLDIGDPILPRQRKLPSLMSLILVIFFQHQKSFSEISISKFMIKQLMV